MFEVRCIVGDKKLRDVLVFLRGNTLEPPVVIPTGETDEGTGIVTPEPKPRQAKVKKRVPRAVGRQGGFHRKGLGAVKVIRDLIDNSGAVRISAREMKQVTVAAGYSPGAYSHALKILVADNTVRPSPDTRGDYDVVKTVAHVPAHEAIQHG